MKTADVDFLSVFLEFVSTSWSWGTLGLLAAVCILIPVALRIAKGSSLREIFGWTNGYVKDKVFLAAIEDIKDLIHEKAVAEDKRMTKHGQEIGEIREAVQDIDRKVAKLEGSFEQYRSK